MASIKGSDLNNETLLPEESLALRWAQRLHLSYPIDIRTVINSFAIVIEEHLPILADAILVNSPVKSSKPIVFLAAALDERRKSFTLAHELGHIVIPWHIGSFACTPFDLDGSLNLSKYATYIELEREANRFAVQILMPRSFLATLIDDLGDPATVVEFLQRSNISKVAASIRLIKLLPPGYMFVQLTSDHQIDKVSKSRDTFWELPEVGELDYTSLESRGVGVHKFDGLNTLVWLNWNSVSHERETIQIEETSLEIFARILDDVGNYGNIQQRVAGVVGAAKNTALRTGVDLYTVLRERFDNRDWFGEIIHHEDFDKFLLTKARELESKH